MTMNITIQQSPGRPSGGNWYLGTVNNFYFEVLVFAEPSRFGIDGGQVSKLYLLDKPRRKGGKELACYERTWHLRPREAKDAQGIVWRQIRGAIDLVVAETSRRERARQQQVERQD